MQGGREVGVDENEKLDQPVKRKEKSKEVRVRFLFNIPNSAFIACVRIT